MEVTTEECAPNKVLLKIYVALTNSQTIISYSLYDKAIFLFLAFESRTTNTLKQAFYSKRYLGTVDADTNGEDYM